MGRYEKVEHRTASLPKKGQCCLCEVGDPEITVIPVHWMGDVFSARIPSMGRGQKKAGNFSFVRAVRQEKRARDLKKFAKKSLVADLELKLDKEENKDG